MNRYFITGTDTDCGKTYATCQMLRYFNKMSIKTLAIKPVASGCDEMQDGLSSFDARLLQSDNPQQSHEICPWRFQAPISPHLASVEHGVILSAHEISSFCFESQYSVYDALLIEGAGGLMVPLNNQETWLDFLKISKIPVILVVGMRLGCLNHALLTATVLQTFNIECKGWVANCIDKDMLALDANIATLEQHLMVPLLAQIDHQGVLQPLPGMRQALGLAIV